MSEFLIIDKYLTGIRMIGSPLTGPSQPSGVHVYRSGFPLGHPKNIVFLGGLLEPNGLPMIRIPYDQLYILTPLTPLIKRRKSVSLS